MARIFYVHWNRAEALVTVRALRAAGHVVVPHHSTEEGAGDAAWRSLRTKPPDALVVSLDRLPSHGRRIAAVIHETKSLRELPVVFVGGAPDKVTRARQEFPRARFTTPGHLISTLESVAGTAPRSRARRSGRNGAELCGAMMKTITAAKFKERCLSLLDDLDADGLVITRQGKPVAKLVPYARQCVSLIGSLKSKIEIHGDVLSTGARWKADAKS